MIFVFLTFTFAISQELNEGKPYTVYVKQTGDDTNTGTEIGQEKKSFQSAYDLLGDDNACKIFIVLDESAQTAEAITFNKNQGITIEGVNSDGTKNEMVTINCDVNPKGNLFTCEDYVEFKSLAFDFPMSLGVLYSPALIKAYNGNLTIKNCQFVRPPYDGGTLNYKLLNMDGGNLYMDSVECVDDKNDIKFFDVVFYACNSNTVLLTNISLKKISGNRSIISVWEYHEKKVDVFLNNCTFTECQTEMLGTLDVYNNNSENSFTVGDGGVTSFISCTGGESCGIYLYIPYIASASQLKWPTNGKNLVFKDCSSEYNGMKRNTGLYIYMERSTLFKEIADAMRDSFAADYTRRGNLWNIVGYDNNTQKECDFVSSFFDPPPPPKQDNMTRAFVKKGGKGNGVDVNSAINSIYDAYDYLEKREKCFIDIIKTTDPVKAEDISFDIASGITIEGVNDNGEGNTEVAIDCDVFVPSILFSCQKTVEFKYLAFQISSTTKNWDTLIGAGYDSISLKISTCRFARIGSQSQEGMMANADGNSPLESSLVSVTSGSVEMDTVKCTDETSFVSFSSSPFSFSGAREVSLKGMDISKVNVQNGAAISINDGINSSSKVSIEGLNINEVKSEKGASAGLDITLSSKESRVAIGRGSKCSFKSCSAPEGKSGAIFIDMPKATSNLKLPSEHNLEIDSSNTAGSKTTSLFIIAPDFDKFCKQEDAFAFANDYDESTAGWIEGANDAESEPEDVYEKYVKVRQEKLKEQNKKRMAGIVVAIVVPIVVVVAVVVIVIVVVVVRKKRSRNEENNGKEQEMND